MSVLWSLVLVAGVTFAGGSFGALLDSLDGGWYPQDDAAPLITGLGLGFGLGVAAVAAMVGKNASRNPVDRLRP